MPSLDNRMDLTQPKHNTYEERRMQQRSCYHAMTQTAQIPIDLLKCCLHCAVSLLTAV